MKHTHAGFTLMELVLTLTIIGILAAMAAPRLSDIHATTQARGFVDNFQTAIRFAQKLAMSSACDSGVIASSGGYSIVQWPTCQTANHLAASSPVIHPGTSTPMQEITPAGLSISGSLNLYFDARGEPRDITSNASLSTVSSMTVGSFVVTVEATTGYAHVN